MKQFLLAVLLLFCSSALFAQTFDTQVSAFSQVRNGTSVSQAWKLGDYLYTIIRDKKQQTLNIYEVQSMKLLSTKVFYASSCKNKENCIDNQFDFIKAEIINGQIIFFLSSYDRKSKEYLLFAQMVDRTGKFEGDLNILDRVSAEKRSNAGSYVIRPSEDSTKFIVVSHPPFDKSNKNTATEKFSFKVFDSKLTNTSSIASTLAFKDKDVIFKQYVLDNDGRLYISCQILLEKSEKERGFAPYYNMIYVFDTKTGKTVDFKVDLSKRNIDCIAIRLNKSADKLYCTGLYSDIKGRQYVGSELDGLFTLLIDSKSMGLVSSKVSPFDKETVAELLAFKGVKELSDRKKKKIKDDQGISNNYEIKDFYVNPDGSARAILENTYVTSTTSCDAKGNCRTTYYYNYDDLIFANFNTKGELLKMSRMLKGQQTANDGGSYLSYFLIEKSGRSYVVFNDNPSNLTLPAGSKALKQLNSPMKASLVGAEIDENGAGKRVELVNNKLQQMICIPKMALRIGDGVYVVPATYSPKIINPVTLAVSCGCIGMFVKPRIGFVKVSVK